MPLYTYECETCKGVFEFRHSIKEYPEKCNLCESVGVIKRLPPVPTIIKKEKGRPEKAGTLVKKFIEEARNDLKKEKEEFKQREQE